MAEHTMQEAGQLVGVGRSTIWRLVSKGKLSAYKNPLGVMVIDSAELYRVFPQHNPEHPATVQVIQEEPTATPEETKETALLRQKVEMLEQSLDDYKQREVRLLDQVDKLTSTLKLIEHKPEQEPVKHWWNIKLW